MDLLESEINGEFDIPGPIPEIRFITRQNRFGAQSEIPEK